MAAPASTAGKPRWLLLGGLGFLGRNLVKYLVDNGLASEIRVADKRAPFMAFLSPDHKAAILGQPELVEFVQVDVSDDDMLEAAFAPPRSGPPAEGGGCGWDVVVHLAAETGFGKREEFYAKGVAGAAKAAKICAERGVRRFLLFSSGQVYKPSASPVAEGAPLKPWTTPAEWALKAEEAARAVPGCPLIILRPATVYGPGDVSSLMPRCVIGAAYKSAGERMDFLWDADLKVATVHVFDVARAAYFLSRKGELGGVYNLVDAGGTDQGKLAALLTASLGVETGFVGSLKSNLAALKMDAVVDAANEKHLGSWLALLKAHRLSNTPLSPYLDKQLLAHNHSALDGSALAALGFKLAVPEPTPETVRDPVAQAIAQGIFPPVL